MKSFYYRSGKNALLALFMGAPALFCGWLWWNGGGWFVLGGMLLFGAGFFKAAQNALNPDPALRLDAHKLTVRMTFSSEEILWRDVQSITLETLTYRYYGVIPIGKVEILCIAANGGLTGTRRLRVSAGTLDLPPGGAGGLLMLVRAAHLAAVGESGVAMAGAGPRGWGVELANSTGEPSGSGFDPDAAIMRYLAGKKESGVSVGVSPPRPPAGLPQRQTFGRRTI